MKRIHTLVAHSNWFQSIKQRIPVNQAALLAISIRSASQTNTFPLGENALGQNACPEAPAAPAHHSLGVKLQKELNAAWKMVWNKEQ